MDGGFPILVFILGAAAVVIFGILSWRAAEARRNALAALARELGWRFDGASDRGVAHELGRVSLFSQGRAQRGANTMRGAIDIAGHSCSGMMGDYQYTTGSGKDKRTHHFSYLVIDLPWPGLPALAVRAEGFMDRIAGALGFDDIDFESSEFSRRFHVKCADKRFAYDLIHPRMMEFLMRDFAAPFVMELGLFCVADGDRRWEPAEFRNALAWASEFFDQWPAHLRESLAARSAP